MNPICVWTFVRHVLKHYHFLFNACLTRYNALHSDLAAAVPTSQQAYSIPVTTLIREDLPNLSHSQFVYTASRPSLIGRCQFWPHPYLSHQQQRLWPAEAFGRAEHSLCAFVISQRVPHSFVSILELDRWQINVVCGFNNGVVQMPVETTLQYYIACPC